MQKWDVGKTMPDIERADPNSESDTPVYQEIEAREISSEHSREGESNADFLFESVSSRKDCEEQKKDMDGK